MAWNAGAIYGTAKLNNSQWTKGFSSMKSVGTAALAAIAAGMTAATIQTEKFEKAFANVRSITDDTFGGISQLKTQLLTLNPVLGETSELAQGVYQAFSSGAKDAENALEITTESAKLGKAILTDTSSAVDIVTTAINAYGEETINARQASDLFFNTVKNGKITGEQLAATIGQSIPMFASMGVSMEDLTAGMITLTKQGVQAAETTTQLNAVVRAFVKPSREMQAALKSAGKESGSFLLKTEGLAGAVKFLNEQTQGNQEELAKLVPNIRGLKGVMGLAAQDGKLLAEALESTKNAAGGANEAFETQEKTFATLKNAFSQMLIATGQLSRGLTVDLAQGATRAFTSIRDMVNGLRGAFNPSEDLRMSASLLNKYLKQQEQVNIDLRKAQNAEAQSKYNQLKASQALINSKLSLEIYKVLDGLDDLEKKQNKTKESLRAITTVSNQLLETRVEINKEGKVTTNIKALKEEVDVLENLVKKYEATQGAIANLGVGLDKIGLGQFSILGKEIIDLPSFRSEIKNIRNAMQVLQEAKALDPDEQVRKAAERVQKLLADFRTDALKSMTDLRKAEVSNQKAIEGAAKAIASGVKKESAEAIAAYNDLKQVYEATKDTAFTDLSARQRGYRRLFQAIKDVQKAEAESVKDTGPDKVKPLDRIEKSSARLTRTGEKTKTFLESLIAQLIATNKKFNELSDKGIDATAGKFDAFVAILGVLKDDLGLTRKQSSELSKVLNDKLPEGAKISSKQLNAVYKETSGVKTVLDRVGESIDRANKRFKKLGEQTGMDVTGKEVEFLTKKFEQLRDEGLDESAIVRWATTTLRWSKEAETALSNVFPDAPDTKVKAEKAGTAWIRELVSSAEKGIKPLQDLLAKGLISEGTFDANKTKRIIQALMPLKNVYANAEEAANNLLPVIKKLNPELNITKQHIKDVFKETKKEGPEVISTPIDHARESIENLKKQLPILKKQLPTSIDASEYHADRLASTLDGLVKSLFPRDKRKAAISFLQELGLKAEMARGVFDRIYPSIKRVNSVLNEASKKRQETIKEFQELSAAGVESNELYRRQEKQLLDIAERYNMTGEQLGAFVEKLNTKLPEGARVSQGQLKEVQRELDKTGDAADKTGDGLKELEGDTGGLIDGLSDLISVLQNKAYFKDFGAAAITMASTLTSAISGATNSVMAINSQLLANERSIMEKEIQGLEAEIVTFDKRIAQSKERAQALRADISKIQQELDLLTDKDDRSRGEQLKDELDELKEQLDRELDITAEQYNLMLEDEESYREGSLEIKLANYDKEKEADENLNNEKIQNLRELIDQRQAALDAEIDALRQEKLAKEKALAEQEAAEKKAQKKKEAREAKIKKKQNEVARKSFDAEKANGISNVWVSTAESILGFWASMADKGPAGWIAAGAMTAATTALAATQTALIAGQEFVKPYPGYAKGGRNIPGGEVIVGEQGPEKLTVPKGSTITNAVETSRELSRMGKTQSINVTTYIQDPVVRDDTDISRIVEMVNSELGQKLGVAI